MAAAFHPTLLTSLQAGLARILTALTSVSDRIVADRRQAVAALQAKSDDDLAKLGLARKRIAQDVHSHLYYS